MTLKNESMDLYLMLTDQSDYLTGFHKRKTERQKKAAEFNKEQARKDRIEARKEVRCSISQAKSRSGMRGRQILNND